MPVDQTYWAETFVSFVIGPFGMDMSFPAATIMFSTSVERKHQGMVASLVTTVVNYSISIALGIAGTVVTYTSPGESIEELITAVHHAAYVGIGLSGVGVVVAVGATILEIIEHRNSKSDKRKDIPQV